jgi:PPOX class probable F420-dependent enzyme
MASWTSEARLLLERGRVGHFATADGAGRPHVVPVCYAFDDAALYFVADEKPKRTAARSLKRLRNLRENPYAALVVDEWDEDWTRLAWVMVRGPARIETDARTRADALARLRARYSQYDAMRLDDAYAHPLVRLSAAHVVSWSAT